MQDTSDIPDTDSVLTAAPGEALAGPRPRGEHGKWTMAIAASCLVHGAVAAAFLISPGSKANLQDPAQAEGSDRSGANVAGSALNPEQQSINVALVPPPRPPAKPMPPAEAAPPAEKTPPVEAVETRAEPNKPPVDPDILVTDAPRNDADSVAPDTRPTETTPAQQQQSASHPPTPAQPPVPAARPAAANPLTAEKSGAADGQTRSEPAVSKGKRQNEAGTRAEDNYRSDVIRKLGRVYRAVPPSLQASARSNTVVTFVIGKQGTIDELRVVESSGSDTFDQIVLGFVRKAAPFPPIPAKIGNRLEFTGAIGPF
ncbi:MULTISPECIES: TonB family protein [unclassified Mesorhizobium]|uniref:energy transducer TonB family protein n=1 Tax=unclassified Mesorhizobium TaxID=325217 RepID=UPI000FDC3EFE|nr:MULTISPECIES: TonB family protein [unclassified Mesorhizobium]TGQ17264.1 energy transducer TonB [Mesorhizobium sp. M2E.F.Ca.ET.219.01.1.1]TGT76579.1 energy transducer TonB [Mesorhizobium sp. M2E.F.Ca.ET.166.01.1.1]TGW02692.1 energy transducer TonB [Mesorhizobium sp. M2E.F.Ca.ET.154.01.1.1]